MMRLRSLFMMYFNKHTSTFMNLYLQPHQVQTIYVLVKLGITISGGNYNVVVGDEVGTLLTTGDNNVEQ